MKRVSILPSLLTIGNFACGFISIALCIHSVRLSSMARQAKATADALMANTELVNVTEALMTSIPEWKPLIQSSDDLLLYACLVIFIGMVFDVFDGRVARMTGAESKFGAELDSLADCCSFGIAPAMIVATMWIRVQPEGKSWWGQVLIFGLVYAACAVLRLARYNVEVGTVDKNYFKGLPSPGAAGAVVSAAILCEVNYLDPAWAWIAAKIPGAVQPAEVEVRILAIYLLLIGWLMVTRLWFVHLANRYLSGRKRFTTLVLLLFAVALLLNYPEEMVFLGFNGYVILSLLGNLVRRVWRKPQPAVVGAPPADAGEKS